MTGKLTFVFLLISAASACAQHPLDEAATAVANRAFGEPAKGEPLLCSIRPETPGDPTGRGKPALNFEFRFQSGYVIHCPYLQFGAKETTLGTFLRVTPEGRPAVLLGEKLKVPGIPPEMVGRVDYKKLKNDVIRTSGVFTVGVGRYLVEVLAIDDRGRSSKGRWTIAAAPDKKQRSIASDVPPLTAREVSFRPWMGRLNPRGLRLTMLVDAAPRSRREVELHAWDVAFLVDTLSSLLEQVPCKSVRLIAFNLDQQRVLYRQDSFAGGRQFLDLQNGIRSLNLGTIDVHVLERRKTGWAELLADLTNKEATAEVPSDAVIFIGPTTRLYQHVPKELIKPPETAKPRFFYFQFFTSPWGSLRPYYNGRPPEFDDTIAFLTKARHGAVFNVVTPEELERSVRKMLSMLGADQPLWPARPAPQQANLAATAQ